MTRSTSTPPSSRAAQVTPNPWVGFFDSGIGGLAILLEAARLLPHHNLLYYADTAHFPFGSQASEEIIKRSLHAARFLTRHGAEAIVVACNTASTVALPVLRRTLDRPFVGVVPAVKPAAAVSKARRVAVLATEGTLRSDAFHQLVEQFASGIHVLPLPAPGLAGYVERGDLDTPDTLQALEHCLAPAQELGVDSLVLGCTHYSFLRPAIERVLGPGIAIVECTAAMAQQVALIATRSTDPSPAVARQARYVTSGNPIDLSDTLDRLRAAGIHLPAGPVSHEQSAGLCQVRITMPPIRITSGGLRSDGRLMRRDKTATTGEAAQARQIVFGRKVQGAATAGAVQTSHGGVSLNQRALRFARSQCHRRRPLRHRLHGHF